MCACATCALRVTKLAAGADKVGHKVSNSYWFDGGLLANYLVSSANFVHPVSRRALDRSEIVALDEYVVKNSCAKPCVLHVFDTKVVIRALSHKHTHSLLFDTKVVIRSLSHTHTRIHSLTHTIYTHGG